MTVAPALDSVIVIAKRPVPGQVKTRLTPPLTREQAAHVAAGALQDTLHAVASVPARDHVLAFAGSIAGWRPPGWRTVAQPDGGLDIRLAAAFAEVGDGPSVLVGMDTPQVRPEQLAAFDPRRYDACLGLAHDGGYWAIGFTEPTLAARTLPGVAMSTARTGAVQLQRLHDAGLHVQLLDTLTDVDTIGTAVEVAGLVPTGAFARALAATAGAA